MTRLAKPLFLLLAGLPLAIPTDARAQATGTTSQSTNPATNQAPNPATGSPSRLPPTTGSDTFPGYSNPGNQTVTNPNAGFLPPNPWAPVSPKNPLPRIPGKSDSESAAIQARDRQPLTTPESTSPPSP